MNGRFYQVSKNTVTYLSQKIKQAEYNHDAQHFGVSRVFPFTMFFSGNKVLL
jgi:hypothetical protein